MQENENRVKEKAMITLYQAEALTIDIPAYRDKGSY